MQDLNIPGLGWVEVEAEYLPPSRGSRSSLGVPEEPDDAGGWEIISVTLDGEEVDLTDEEVDLICRALDGEVAFTPDWEQGSFHL